MVTLATDGHVASGFEPVAEAFERSFTDYGEVGAAFAAYHEGALVVDLWGGLADAGTSRRWSRDILQLIFSGTKGMVATCMTILIDRGGLRLPDPVARYWPEFGTSDKEHVTVADVVSHQARLPGITQSLLESDLMDDVRMASLLASQPLEADPRAAKVYHALTYGWLCGEIVRRVTNRSIGRFFAAEVAQPLGLDLWIGLPKAQEPRVSTLSYGPGWGSDPKLVPEILATDRLQASIYANPTIFPAGDIPWNTGAFHAAEIPAANAIGTARSIARLYGALAGGGALEDVRLCSATAVELARKELVRFRDPFSDEPMAYGVGFALQTELELLGPPATAFGHAGAGGSAHGAWPEQRVGFSYAMNQMRGYPNGDPRPRALLTALYEVVR